LRALGSRWPRTALRWTIVGVIGVLALVALALMPVTTQRGVDYEVATERLPLYLKVLDFVGRDANYRLLVKRITDGQTTAEARMSRLGSWVRANVRDVPPGLPVVDDHVWSIVVRGYGTDEQKTDVFSTLATYAGIPSYWINFRIGPARLPVALVRIEGRWRMVDVANDLVFRTREGALAGPDDVAADPAIVATAAGGRRRHGHAYADYFAGLRVPAPPAMLRAEQQMPGPRLLWEIRKRVGLGGREWDDGYAVEAGTPAGKAAR
jgi:transglutaminase-like putative cysteine protease